MAKKSKKKPSKNKASTHAGKSAVNDELTSKRLIPNDSALTVSNIDPDTPSLQHIGCLPPSLLHVYPTLTPKQQILVKLLCSPVMGQCHLFESWPFNTELNAKITFIQQLERFNESCPNGLSGYLTVDQKCQISGNTEELLTVDCTNASLVGFVITVEDNEESNDRQSQFFFSVLEDHRKNVGKDLKLCIVASKQRTFDELCCSLGIDIQDVDVLVNKNSLPIVKEGRIVTQDLFCVATHKPRGRDIFLMSKIVKDWVNRGLEYICFCENKCDLNSSKALQIKAYRIDSSSEVYLSFRNSKALSPAENIINASQKACDIVMENPLNLSTDVENVRSNESIVLVASHIEEIVSIERDVQNAKVENNHSSLLPSLSSSGCPSSEGTTIKARMKENGSMKSVLNTPSLSQPEPSESEEKQEECACIIL